MDQATSDAWRDWQRNGEIGAALRNMLIDYGWLDQEPSEAGFPSPVRLLRRPVLRAVLCLLRARRILRDSEIVAAIAWARQHRQPASPNLPDLPRLLDAFRRAEGFFPNSRGDDDCLPRSLALYAFLISYGVSATHHIGVKRFPFEAHAWVSCEGIKLLEDDAVMSAAGFTPLMQSN